MSNVGTALQIVEDESAYGPAMRALSPKFRAFVHAKVQQGLSNRRAAQVAGYSATNDNVLDQSAYRLSHDPRIIAAIHEETKKLMHSEGANSIRVVVSIRDDLTADAPVRLKAALALMDRSGFNAVSEQRVSVEHTMSDAEMDRRILMLCSELGIGDAEARKMLIDPKAKPNPLLEAETIPEATDAEFEPVRPDDEILDELLSPNVPPEPEAQE